MIRQQGLLNKRPGMKQFNRDILHRQEDEDDQEDINASSFTKSKVDDDDDKFKAREEDHDFLDFGHNRSVSPSNIFNSLQNKLVSPIPSNPLPPLDTSQISSIAIEDFQKNEQARYSTPYRSPNENQKMENHPIEEISEMESQQLKQQPYTNKSSRLTPSPKQSTPQQNISPQQAYDNLKTNNDQSKDQNKPSLQDQQKIQQLTQPQQQNQQSIQNGTPKQEEQNGQLSSKQVSNPETPIPFKHSEYQSVDPLDIKWKDNEQQAIHSMQTWHTSHFNAQGKVSFYACPNPPFQKQKNLQKTPPTQQTIQKSALKSPKPKEIAIIQNKNIKEIEAETPSFEQISKDQIANKQTNETKLNQSTSEIKKSYGDRVSQKPETIPQQVMANSSSQQSTRIEKQRSVSNYEYPPPSKFQSEFLNSSMIQSSIKSNDSLQKVNYKPNFVRRGQTTFKELEKKLSQGSEDKKICTKNVINQRNLRKAYILSENPSFYQQSEYQYVDRMFPPNLSIIYQKRFNEHDLISFNRAAQTIKRQITLLNVAEPNDICPGELSSNGLIGALCGICEIIPEALTRVFENQVINSNGFYYLRLNIDGVWRYIVIDDFLPIKGEQLLCSGSSQDNRIKKLTKAQTGYAEEIWVSLIEKAISKIYGSYEDLQLANLSLKDAYMLITGAPSEEYNIINTESQKLADILQQYNSKEFIIQLYGSQCDPSEYLDKLNSLHEFPCTVQSYDCAKQEIKLRNHQGWLKDPSTFKNTTIKFINQEGEFVISVKDASYFFKTINVCKYKSGWWTTTIGVNQLPNTFSSFNLEIQEDTDSYLTFIQRDSSLYRNNLKQKYEYSFSRIILVDKENNYFVSKGGQQKNLCLKAQLKKGCYQIIICHDQNELLSESYLQYYGSIECKINQLSYLQNPNLIAELFGQECLKQGSLLNSRNNIDTYLWICESLKLCSYTWQYKGKTPLKHKQILKQTLHKDLLQPLSFINQEEAKNIYKLKSFQIAEKKKQCWLKANELEIDFQPNSIYSIVFKASDKNQIIDNDFLKKIGLF